MLDLVDVERVSGLGRHIHISRVERDREMCLLPPPPDTSTLLPTASETRLRNQ